MSLFPTPGPDFYEEVGGRETFARLVRVFYAGVAEDPVLRPLYPEQDLAPAAQRLQLFLEQYWGGPTDYQQLRGHPRLRMRHAPFAVTPTARVHWLTHMRHALDSLELPPQLEQPLWTYLRNAADAMVNTDEPTADASFDTNKPAGDAMTRTDEPTADASFDTNKPAGDAMTRTDEPTADAS